jgi:GNAT superfamily N-acetyltransferase
MAEVKIQPLTAERWDDVERLFGTRGACGGCWCMWFRLRRADYEAGKGDGNRERFRARVREAAVPAPGVLAYREGEAVGWCAVAPREEYRRLQTTRTMRGPDDLPVWAILCLFVARGARREGLSIQLIEGASEYAFANGAPAVEAYPVVPHKDMPPVFASQGTLSAYEAAGFEMVARPSETRAVVRRYAP